MGLKVIKLSYLPNMAYTLVINYALAFLLSFLVSGNNLSANAGAAVGSRSIDYKYAVIIALLGYILGLWLQGTYMRLMW